MKKILVILVVLYAATLCGCKKFLNQQPLSQLSASSFWKTPDDITAGMAGIYSGVQSFIGDNMVQWGEVRSDAMKNTGYGPTDYMYNGLTSSSKWTDWSEIYTTINRVNVALVNIPKVSDPDSASVNDALGQCYAIRAYCYFWLVRVWGAAPVWLKPYTDLSQNPDRTRTPADSILNSVVLPDLQKAVQLINPNDNTVWYVNLGGIYSIMMDVYMWQHDYQDAISSANKLFALNRYQLDPMSNWKNLFINPTTTKGNIWSIHWDYLTDGGCNLGTAYGYGNTNNQFTVSDTVANYFLGDAADLRGLLTVDYANSGYDKVWKFYPQNLSASGNQIYPTNSQTNIYAPLYRLAGIYLLYAEALEKTGDETNAIKYLNMVHTRAGLAPYTAADFPDTTTLLNAILWEREVELWGEGKRWFDLIRNGEVLSVMNPLISERQAEAGVPVTGFGSPDKILFPINRDVLNASPLLVQNPGY
jgi:tetratricopeptide (TPR) repeat protein